MRVSAPFMTLTGFAVRRGLPAAGSAPAPPAAGALPYAPVIQQITANGSGGVTITWIYAAAGDTTVDLADGVTSVSTSTLTPAIYHSTTNGAGLSGTKVTASAGATSHTFTAGAGSPRYFVMTAENAVGESEQSAQRAATIT